MNKYIKLSSRQLIFSEKSISGDEGVGFYVLSQSMVLM